MALCPWLRWLAAGASLTAAALTGTGATASPRDDKAPPAFRDPALPWEQRVNDLVSRLTVAEKVGQLMMSSPAIPHLGIPAYDWWNEGLHGVARNGYATVFPQAIALAATWDPALHERIAEVISTEARAKNNDLVRRTGGASARFEGLTIWSPNINIFRDPRWGRGQETYGEDPFLTGRFAVAFIRGLQGSDPRYLKTVATVKHFVVHSGPEGLRHQFDAVVSERDLHETYLPAFEAGIREGGAWSLMSAYNAIDGIPAPANRRLLTDILRGDWGFQGAVVGDVDTVADMYNPRGHHYSPDAAHASAAALKAGNDLCSGTTYDALPEALKKGLVTEKDLDVALHRLFLLRMKLGQFDPPAQVPYTAIPPSENGSAAHDALALAAAEESLVLLKNDGTLPWSRQSIHTLAILGPCADDRAALLGNYSGQPEHPVTLLSGMRAAFAGSATKVLYEPGAGLAPGYRQGVTDFSDGILFADKNLVVRGLTRDVFAGSAISGAAQSTRIDRQISLRWSSYEPVSGVPITGAAIRWTGWLVPPSSGTHILSVTVNGGVRLSLDSKRLIDSWQPAARRIIDVPVALEMSRAKKIELDFIPGSGAAEISLGWRDPADAHAIDRALNAARAADHIILVLGLTPELEGEEMKVDAEGFQGGDRTSIRLPGTQRELLDRVSALGKPVTLVLTTGSALAFDPSKANAVLVAWYYGQRGGDAVAAAILGDVSPAGRLPVTFYASDSDLPPFTDYSMANRTYRYFSGKPLYAFGFGLSYARVVFDRLQAPRTASAAGPALSVRVSVRNTERRAADEVVEIYARALTPPVPMPRHWLVGFRRIHLESGMSRDVEIPVAVDCLRRWDEKANRYVIDSGDYELAAGPSSDHLPVSATITVD